MYLPSSWGTTLAVAVAVLGSVSRVADANEATYGGASGGVGDATGHIAAESAMGVVTNGEAVAIPATTGTNAKREYTTGVWASTYYRLQETRLDAIGLVNDDAVFMAGKSAISAVRGGFVTPILEVVDGDIVAFHLCNHRNSFFYEVLMREGGGVALFEYNLLARTKTHLRDFQDVAPANSLACVDRLLLRASPAGLYALSLRGGPLSVLREFHAGVDGGSDAVGALSVGFAADVFTRSVVYGVVPRNRSVVRFRLAADGVGEHIVVHSSEVVLPGGAGNDGPLRTASVFEPRHVRWTRDRLVVADGCSLRELRRGHVRTLLGAPTACVSASEERIEPVGWASRISPPAGLASASDGTAGGAVLALTAGQVVRLHAASDDEGMLKGDDTTSAKSCAAHLTEEVCGHQHGCGWAQGEEANQRECLDCPGLHRWARGEECRLEAAPVAGTRYNLVGCGCLPPPPVAETEELSEENDVQDDEHVHHPKIYALLVAASLLTCVGGLVVHRSRRRSAQMLDLYGAPYGADTADFHIFTDNECPHS